MLISSNSVLKTAFALKGAFAKGSKADSRKQDGVEIAPYKGNAKAAISISADLELSWALRARGSEERTALAARERSNIGYLVSLFEEYGIPITWAVVGHLFLRNCKLGAAGIAHEAMPRPVRNERWEGDWYLHDPCSNYTKDPLWYAPDLIECILRSSVRHEIGTHTFSHIDFSCSNRDLVRKELEECIRAMQPFGLTPRSIVFPHNIMGYSYADVLSASGIIAARHRDARVALSYPQSNAQGLYKIFESMNLRRASHYDYPKKATIMIQAAIRRGASFHIWFHPSDPLELFANEFRRIVESISLERRTGKVWVTTMAELASYCEARKKACFEVKRDRNEIQIMLESGVDAEKFGVPELSFVIKVTSPPRGILLRIADEIKDLKFEPTLSEEGGVTVLVNVPVGKRKGLVILKL